MKRKNLINVISLGNALCASMLLGGCTSRSDSASSGNDGKVVIYSNADDEAVDAMKKSIR